MKNLIFILLLTTNCLSQTELWPINNAEWYYTVTDYMTYNGYSHYWIDRDTIVDGKNAQIYGVTMEGYGGWGYFNYTNDTRLIIALEDSVLYSYNDSLNFYDTLMNFKADLGDKWTTLIDDEWCPGGIYLDTVVTKVIGLTTEMVNGRNLKKYTLNREHTYDQSVTTTYNEDFYQQFGADFLFAINYPCSMLDAAVETELRCFTMDIGEPNEFTYSPFPQQCDYVGIEELSIDQEKYLIKVTDLIGRETEEVPNAPLIYIYSDGTTEKVFRVK